MKQIEIQLKQKQFSDILERIKAHSLDNGFIGTNALIKRDGYWVTTVYINKWEQEQ